MNQRTRRFARIGVGAGALIAVLWLAGNPGVHDARAATAAASDDLPGRTALGLPIDGIDSSSPSFSPHWGTSLTSAEEKLLDARAGLQVALGSARDAVDKHADQALGVFFDQAHGGGLTIALTADSGPGVLADISAALPYGTAYTITTAPRSLAVLRSLQANVLVQSSSLEADGVTISAVGLDAIHDVVMVLISSGSVSLATSAFAQFGNGVVFEEGSITPTACTTAKNCIPIRGGLEMLNPLHPGYEQCSTGYNARPSGSSSTRYVLSAGHCWRDETDSSFIHNGNTFATAKFSPFQRTTGTHYSDSLLVTRNSYGTGTPMNSVFIPNDTTTYTITGQTNLSGQNVGDYVCNVGVNATQARCGYITVDNDVVQTQPGGRWGSTTWTLFGQERASFTTTSGDSGGPVYILHRAYGIAWGVPDSTHTEYSPIDQIQNDMSNFGSVGFRLCFDSSCS
jgi:hypothetical protein